MSVLTQCEPAQQEGMGERLLRTVHVASKIVTHLEI